MKTLTIRQATLGDMPHILALISQPDMSPGTSFSDQRASELFKTITETPFHRLYAVESDSSIVGTFALIAIQQLSHQGAKSIVIEDIVVKTDMQGEGIGKRIMQFAVEEAKSLGCYKMILSSGNARKQAHKFYKGLGFKRDGIRFTLNL